MDGSRFDDLARRLVRPLHRRRLLATATAFLVGARATARPAGADDNCGCGAGSTCMKDPDGTFRGCCGGTPCYDGAGRPVICCQSFYPYCCGGVCCQNGQVCVAPGRCVSQCPAGGTPCGFVCCPAGQECAGDNRCIPACAAAETRCGEACCTDTQVCQDGACVDACAPSFAGKRTRRAPGRTAGICCNPGTEIACNDRCCSKEDRCCFGAGGTACCPSTKTCCTGADGAACCDPAESYCCNGGCCANHRVCTSIGCRDDCLDGGVKCGRACCAAGKVCVGPETCADCGPGETPCGGKACCAAGQVCKDGACAAACAKGQTPCGDACCGKNEHCKDGRCKKKKGK